ncbi:hypothetical protein RE431_08075 [Christiangramia sp. SM2212]|uniref:Uncharacterized protein n=1 Tax=Christiangramia sediminicola TaxID=3073267 RepID=A0ABU1EQW8_9FLAO|nr:hypothetical protein [Christiangramia sp. SM2212]
MELILPDIYKPNILYQVGDGMLKKKMRDSERISSPDVVFLGSSHAYYSFDPVFFDKIGVSSFNWGTSQQTHPQTQMVIKEYITQNKPKLVIYEVFPEIFAMSGRESMADFLNAGEPFEVSFGDIWHFDNSIALINTYLIKYSRRILGVKDKTEFFDDKESYDRGFIKETNLNNNPRNIPMLKWVPRENQLKAFEENLKLLKDLDIPVLLVIAPYPFDYKNSDDFMSYLQPKAKLLSYKEILEFDEIEDFSDFHHLNYNGVLKMNRHLIEFLTKNNYLSKS